MVIVVMVIVVMVIVVMVIVVMVIVVMVIVEMVEQMHITCSGLFIIHYFTYLLQQRLRSSFSTKSSQCTAHTFRVFHIP